MNRQERILGCLIGAAAGDAMGAVTETRNREQIKEKFGGFVSIFLPAPDDVWARGNKPGQVTDDFSQAYILLKNIIENNGLITQRVTEESLLEWASIDNFLEKFAGPTTRAAIEALRTKSVLKSKFGFNVVNENDNSTNGAAMKASPIALFSNGDLDLAIRNAITISEVTHKNDVAISSAAAVASATSEAMQKDSTLESILEAALYGARQGDIYGKKIGAITANPSFEKKMNLAISIGYTSVSLTEAMEKIADIVGTNVFAYESVAAAFGLIVAANGNACDAIFAGVNVGDDTDSVATITGGILGAFNGSGAFPDDYLNILNNANDYDLGELSMRIDQVIGKAERDE